MVVGADVCQGGIYALYFPFHGPGALPGGVLGVVYGLGVYDVRHSFRGGKVHASVEKGPLCELPGLGMAGAQLE